ncbi:MAG: hypothetical protein HY428_01700 [Candidatus Levybacteria bacterium]|nr:hypothetical protein [Candidatus Levybacteria bacterium]
MADDYRETGRNQDPRWQTGIELVSDFVGSLHRRGLLPNRFPTQTTIAGPQFRAEAPKVDLRLATFELLSRVREPSSAEQEALRARGYTFVPVGAKSLGQVVAEHPDHFWYVNNSKRLGDYTPPAMVVALRPKLALPNGFDKSQADQLALIEAHSRDLETEFPDAKAVMLPAVAYVQADIAYVEQTGQPLFRDFYVRALDQTDGSGVAGVGRLHPSRRLVVRGWRAHGGDPNVGAVPAVVFLQK